MGQPSTLKPPRSNPFLQPFSNWKGKPPNSRQARKRNRNPNNSNRNRRKQQTRNAAWTQEQGHSQQAYQPPRLQDLQFQNRLKASRYFPKRFNRRDAPFNSARALMVDSTVASVPGFGTAPPVPFNAPRGFAADAPAPGLVPGALEGTAPVLGLAVATSRSLVYTGNGISTASGLPAPDLRAFSLAGKGMVVPGTLQFTGKSGACMAIGPSVASGSSGALDFAAAAAAAADFGIIPSRALDFTVKRDASTSGLAAAVPRVSGKASASFKRHRAFYRSHRALSVAPNGPPKPAAPRNTTSFLMRAKKSGGIASLVSPSPVTPAVIPTPVMSPSPAVRGLADEANQEWGVNGYGSMNGLIRLRSLELGREDVDDNDSESEVEQGAQSVQQLEQRLDQDVSRFVMTYPSNSVQNIGQNLLETRMDDQDGHIAHLEEENLDLKERLHFTQREVEELRRRVQILEGVGCGHEEEAEASSGRSVADVSCL